MGTIRRTPVSRDGLRFPLVSLPNPYLTLPNGTRIDLEVDGGIPYLNMDAQPYSNDIKSAPVVVGDVGLAQVQVDEQALIEIVKSLNKSSQPLCGSQGANFPIEETKPKQEVTSEFAEFREKFRPGLYDTAVTDENVNRKTPDSANCQSSGNPTQPHTNCENKLFLDPFSKFVRGAGVAAKSAAPAKGKGKRKKGNASNTNSQPRIDTINNPRCEDCNAFIKPKSDPHPKVCSRCRWKRVHVNDDLQDPDVIKLDKDASRETLTPRQ